MVGTPPPTTSKYTNTGAPVSHRTPPSATPTPRRRQRRTPSAEHQTPSTPWTQGQRLPQSARESDTLTSHMLTLTASQLALHLSAASKATSSASTPWGGERGKGT
jgi:hypothetical protein